MLHNKFFILNWDFSVVDPQGSPEEIKKTLHQYLNSCMRNFAVKYQTLLTINIEFEPTNAFVAFMSILTAVQQTPYKLYLLIDEYDNFANEIMMGGRPGSEDRYKALLYGEGLLKSLCLLILQVDTILQKIFL